MAKSENRTTISLDRDLKARQEFYHIGTLKKSLRLGEKHLPVYQITLSIRTI